MQTQQINSSFTLNTDSLDCIATEKNILLAEMSSLTPSANGSYVIGRELKIAQLNSKLFSHLKAMVGKNHEHMVTAHTFLNCDRLVIEKLVELTDYEFDRLCCGGFIGFKSSLTIDEVYQVLDDVQPIHCDHGLCRMVQASFSRLYWTMIWEMVRFNFNATLLCSNLPRAILDKLSIVTLDQVNRLALLHKQTFGLNIPRNDMLQASRSVRIGHVNPIRALLPESIPPLTVSLKRNKLNKGNTEPDGMTGAVELTSSDSAKETKYLIEQWKVPTDRLRLEDEFIRQPAVKSQLLTYLRISQCEVGIELDSQREQHSMKLSDIPDLTSLAKAVVDETSGLNVDVNRLSRSKRYCGYWLGRLGGQLKHIRILFGVTEAQAKTLHNQGVGESLLLKGRELPALSSKRLLWQILASLFVASYIRIAGEKGQPDNLLEATLDVWTRLIRFFAKPEWVLFAPYVAKLSLFLDIALWLRESKLKLAFCPSCGVWYVYHEGTQPVSYGKKTRSRQDDDPSNDGLSDCPFCNLAKGLS